MSFKSVKLFGVLTLLFLAAGFTVSLLERGVVGLTEILAKSGNFSEGLKLFVLILGGALLLISLQTLYCRGKGKLDVALHLTAGLSLFTLFLVPFTWQSKTLYLYPYSYVKVGETTVGMKGVEFGSYGIAGDFFVEKEGNRVEEKVAFNRPLISEVGFLWIKGTAELNGVPAIEVSFSPFSPAPILFITLFGVFTILLGVRLVKGGRDVHESGGEGAPETDRRALKTD